MRFTWVKDRTAAIDRLLSTNGAHSVPSTYRLTDGDRCAATVTFKAGQWVWYTATDRKQGRAATPDRAKASAKEAAREEGLL